MFQNRFHYFVQRLRKLFFPESNTLKQMLEQFSPHIFFNVYYVVFLSNQQQSNKWREKADIVTINNHFLLVTKMMSADKR